MPTILWRPHIGIKQTGKVLAFHLQKKGCLILASGYNALLREKIVNRWEELELANRGNSPMLPTTYKDALKELLAKVEENETLALENKQQAEKIEQDAPKVNFANAIVGGKSSCLIGELAKIITQNGCSIGQNRLFKWLRDNGYLGIKGERYNVPNQKYVEQGLFEVKKGVRSGNDGVMHTTLTSKVTGKGQVYFVNKFLHNNDICKSDELNI